MSSLWTPSGEHNVPKDQQGAAPSAPSAPTEPAGDQAPIEIDPAALGLPPDFDIDSLSPDQRAELEAAAQQVAQIRAELAETPPEIVIANHLMGMYELASVHLTQDEPNMEAARLAIDALGSVIDNCQGRLGEYEESLVGARQQLQMAFVEIARDAGEQE